MRTLKEFLNNSNLNEGYNGSGLKSVKISHNTLEFTLLDENEEKRSWSLFATNESDAGYDSDDFEKPVLFLQVQDSDGSMSGYHFNKKEWGNFIKGLTDYAKNNKF